MTRIPQTSSVTAGLLGASALAVPARAYGFALADASKVGVLTADFLLGLVAGAASCGAVALAVSVASSRSKKRAGAAVPMDRTTVTNKTGDFQIPRAQPAMGPAQADAAAVPEAAAAPASGAAPVVHDARNGCPSNPRHLRDRVPEVDRKVPVRKAPAAPAPVVKPASATQKPNRPAQHEATDYTDIATNYVHRKTVADRAKSRARGVKQLLAERMSRDMFDDLPVIQRADGTVGDVGTGWWNLKVGNSVKNDFSDLAAQSDDGFSIDMTGEHNELKSYDTDDAPLEGAARIAYISKRIAQVDEGVFPEHRNPEELDSEDLWDQAMKSMEKRGRELPQPFDRITADGEAGDAKDQEAPTQVIPFRVPAGHPEVVDTATYVDYLISQEFDKNSSQAVRQTSRDYLRVIEGGSQSSQPTVINVPKRKPRTGAHKPKHMASPTGPLEGLPIAREA